MPIKDLRSNIKPIVVMNSSITTNTTTNSAILDTADYDLGVVFSFQTATWTDGTYTPAIYQSDDPAMAGATLVGAANLIGVYSEVVISGATSLLDTLKTIGVRGTLRYLQVQITSTSVTTGARLIVDSINQPEVLPTVDTNGL